MTRRKARSWLVAVVFPFVGSAVLTAAQTRDAERYAPYLGTYAFEDGTRVTGGRMDEGGVSRLLYIDTESVERAGVFQWTEEGFVRAFNVGRARSLAFEDDGRIMRWEESSGRVLVAKRVMHPEPRPAQFSNDGVKLSGSLYFPPDEGRPLSAVVLAHGSGPVTRYAGPWTTFFLEQGLAVLSYDKRGTGESDGDWRTSTYLDLADDLSAAVDWVREQPGIDAVGVKTTSQSGWYGPHAARMNRRTAFLIQRAAPAVDIGVGTAHEIREEWRAEGLEEDVVELATGFWLELHRLAGDEGSLQEARELVAEAERQAWFEPAFGDWLEIDSGWWERHVANMPLAPAEDVSRLAIPVLWFLAEEDENVPYAASMTALRAAKDANRELEIVTVHDAPHSFVIVDELGSSRYTDEYWQVMAGWLAEQGFADGIE